MKIILIVFLSISFYTFGQNLQQNDSISYKNHYKIAINYYKSSEYNKAIDEWNTAIKCTNSKYDKSKCLINAGVCYKLLSKYDSAFYCYSKARDVAIAIDSVKLLGKINNNLGVLSLRTGAYNKAQEHLLLALKYKKEENNIKAIGSTLLNLGEVQLRLNNWDKAEDYYLQSLQLREQVADTFGITSCCINLGIVNKRRGHYIKAKRYYDDALKYCDASTRNMDDIRLIVYENMGELSTKKGNFEKAIFLYNIALELANKINSLFDIAHCKNEIALVKLEQGLPHAALKLSKESFLIAENANIFEKKESYSYTISKAYEKLGNYKKAIKWSRKHEIYKDSILTIDKIREVQGMEYEYQTQQKETKILKLSNQNNEQKAQLAQSRLINISGASVLLLLSGLGLFFWHKKKQQQKLKLLESSVKASEQAQKRIGKELHDGIAGSLIKLVHDTEGKQQDLSDKLLHTYHEIRELSHQLDNTPMHGELFMERLFELIPKSKDDQVFTFKIIPNHLDLKEPYGTHVYRIIQELIANNLKHAKATKTSIRIALEKEQLQLNYTDNGIGVQNLKKGRGFKNIEDRLALMQGELIIDKDYEGGFKLDIYIQYSS